VFQVARQYRTDSCQVNRLGFFVDEKHVFGFAKLTIFDSDRSAGQADEPHRHVEIDKKRIGGKRIAVTAIPYLRNWLDVRMSGRLYF
jgi:hypothetical protein